MVHNEQFFFDNINVNQIFGTSGVFVGTNYQINWSSANKSNQAIGHIFGDYNLFNQNINIVFDNDMLEIVGNRGDSLTINPEVLA